MNKYLIKDSFDKIHTLSENGDSLVYPNIVEPLTQADYEKWGMGVLGDYSNPVDRVMLQMEDVATLEDGKIFRRKIDKSDFKVNGLEGMEETENTIKHLVKFLNKVQVLHEGEWLDTGLTEPLAKPDFEEYGMDDLSIVPASKWDELDDEFEIITWTDVMDSDKFIEITTDVFIPIEKISESDFEVLMWTVDMELEEPPKIELDVPPFRPIDKLDNQFSIVMGEYEPE